MVARYRSLRTAVLGTALLAAAAPLALFGYGWLTYQRLEKSIVEKMDQYYLNLSTPGREEYLLEDDEVFEVPYMASQLSVSALPTQILDLNGKLIGEFSIEKSAYVRDPEELPGYLKKALIATEDRTFYEHRGVNYQAIARAMLVNFRSLRAKQGGSTLTQQLAKLMFTTRKKTLGRKIFEALCARKIESKFTKDQIILMYLNFVYFGHGCFGVEAASRYYFGKPAANLELAEAALLAGIVASPHNYSPYEKPELARARHKTVLTRMAANGYIPAAAVERYWSEFWKSMDARIKAPESSFWKMRVNEAPYAVETVRRALEKKFSKERIIKGGLKVHTTFDLDCQKAAQTALQEGLRVEHSTTAAPVEGGLAAVRPSDGAILALVGGRAFNFANQLNRAVDIARPMGSSVKPFIFAAAFESGRYGPEDKMLDAPLHFNIPGGKKWSPHNYGNKYFGEITLRDALQRSLNSIAIKLLKEIRIDDVRSLLAQAAGTGIEVFPRNLSLALGTADLSPLQSAAAYALLANGGFPVKPHFIEYIEDRSGAILEDNRAQPEPPARVLSAKTTALLTDIMEGVLRKNGTAHGAALKTGFNIPAAGKTGTTNEYRDAWFSGFTPDIAASVWVGHDDMRIALERGRTGGGVAAPIWMNFIKAVYRDRPTRAFDKAELNR